MQASIIGIRDAGTTDLRDSHGRMIRVGLLHFIVSVNESKPEAALAYYHLSYQDSVFKMLNRLTFITPDKPGDKTEMVTVRRNTGLKETPQQEELSPSPEERS